ADLRRSRMETRSRPRTRAGRTGIPPRRVQLRCARLGALQKRANGRRTRGHAKSAEARNARAAVPRARKTDSGGKMKTLFLLAMPLFALKFDDCFALRGDRSE